MCHFKKNTLRDWGVKLKLIEPFNPIDPVTTITHEPPRHVLTIHIVIPRQNKHRDLTPLQNITRNLIRPFLAIILLHILQITHVHQKFRILPQRVNLPGHDVLALFVRIGCICDDVKYSGGVKCGRGGR
ncbi:hypothetical protein ACHAXS_007005 [Conticribra weissflogii]